MEPAASHRARPSYRPPRTARPTPFAHPLAQLRCEGHIPSAGFPHLARIALHRPNSPAAVSPLGHLPTSIAPALPVPLSPSSHFAPPSDIENEIFILNASTAWRPASQTAALNPVLRITGAPVHGTVFWSWPTCHIPVIRCMLRCPGDITQESVRGHISPCGRARPWRRPSIGSFHLYSSAALPPTAHLAEARVDVVAAPVVGEALQTMLGGHLQRRADSANQQMPRAA